MKHHNGITSQGGCEHYIELIYKAVVSSNESGMTRSLASVTGREAFLELENKRRCSGGRHRGGEASLGYAGFDVSEVRRYHIGSWACHV